MCGIAGIVGVQEPGWIDEMVKVQSHRGPDDDGSMFFEGKGVSLGHRRLSIIDLSPGGHQPMANPQKNIWITYNGEIYNYKDIRNELRSKGYEFRTQSDTEVLLIAYEEWGEKCLDKLNGMFAFAIYDARFNKIFAARDRVGIKPFYYYSKDGIFVFASEIKAIFECPLVNKSPDFGALATPARYQVHPTTGFKDVYKLAPASYIIYENNELAINQYWNFDVQEHDNKPLEEVVAELDKLITDAARLQMIADVPVGAFLSGGLDSSLICALMRRQSDQDLHAFTIRFSDADQKHEKMPDDSFFAKKVSQHLGFKYHEFEVQPDIERLLTKMVWHMDEPLSDSAAINTYLMSKAARDEGIVVLLNGMGADEVFGGYRKHMACLGAEHYQKVVPAIFRKVIESTFASLPVATSSRGFKSLRWAKRFFSFASLPGFERYLASDLALSQDQFKRLMKHVHYKDSLYYKKHEEYFNEYEGSLLTRMCVNDTKLFLPEHNLTYTDKATMWASIESRPPLTDHRIIEYMFSLAPKFRISNRKQKFLLKKVAEKYLPNEIIYRPKASFGSPLRSWIRGALAPMIADTLSESNMQTKELYDPKEVARVIDRNNKGLEDNSLVILNILTTELWYRMNFSSM